MTKFVTALFFVLLPIVGVSGNAQDQVPSLDGPKQMFHDELLDKMVGSWNLTGKVMGQAASDSVEAGWVLNHHFSAFSRSMRTCSGWGQVRGNGPCGMRQHERTLRRPLAGCLWWSFLRDAGLRSALER